MRIEFSEGTAAEFKGVDHADVLTVPTGMNMNQTMTVPEVAAMLNVTPKYVVKLIRDGKLRASVSADGRHTVASRDAKAYRLEARRRGRKALEELARVSQEAGIYGKQK
ncbi:helix-turn-helix domain-containing protein [Paraburkholderia graminis]|uniref:Excisionase family DNA binding protein n=1 Tax=Paraburkholderia graminis TaxID=60548 RepID=A0ABD5CDX4_9BURK|nr:helix-turn-helix domain-containing protein [Paraburkholderia graminis]MDR6202147.1 excisionase family DNA binding protein [Paraburkholderia graminis]